MSTWSNLAKVVYKRTYSRNDTGRYENWEDTVNRVLVGNKVPTKEEFNKLQYFMLARKATGAGRGLWFSGAPAHESLGGAALNNCWFTTADDIENFVMAQDLLMLGGGVGLSVEHKFVSKLPKIKKNVKVIHIASKDADYIVPDSRAGWNELTRRTLESFFFTGKSFTFSTVCVRGAGEYIKGFGGRASGPQPLIKFIENINNILNAREGKHVRPIDAADMICATGEFVVAGNVRRSAIIILGDAWDKDYLKLKRWDLNILPSYRAMANYSVVVDDVEDLHPLFWKTYEQGEPFGIFNRKNAQMFGRMGEKKKDTAEGINPCFHPDTLIQTMNGPIKISDIKEPTHVYTMLENGALTLKKATASWISKKNAETLKLTINTGSYLIVTPEHKIFIKDKGWVEAKDVRIGDRVVHLARTRRGSSYSGVRLTSQSGKEQKMEHRLIWEGVFGTIPNNHDIHHIDGNTFNNIIDNLECLSHEEHARLTANEQPNNHQVWGDGGNFISGPNSRKGLKIIKPLPEELKTGLTNWPIIKSIEIGPITDVYDISVEDTHNMVANNIIAHNCAEATLENGEPCNLQEIFLPNLKDETEFIEASVLMHRYGKRVTCEKYHNPINDEVVKRNRRIGTGITGCLQSPLFTQSILDRAYKAIEVENIKYSNELKIPPSIRTTVVKPSGTLSLLGDVTPGIHPAYSKYYIRRVRFAANDRLIPILKNAGHHIEPVQKFDGTLDHNTFVVDFYCNAPENTPCADEGFDTWKQLDTLLMAQRYWADQAVSVTVYYKKEELNKIKLWLTDNLKNIKTISFLCHNDHGFKQAPLESTTKEIFEKSIGNIKSIDIDSIDGESILEGLECEGGVCPVK